MRQWAPRPLFPSSVADCSLPLFATQFLDLLTYPFHTIYYSRLLDLIIINITLMSGAEPKSPAFLPLIHWGQNTRGISHQRQLARLNEFNASNCPIKCIDDILESRLFMGFFWGGDCRGLVQGKTQKHFDIAEPIYLREIGHKIFIRMGQIDCTVLVFQILRNYWTRLR